MMIEMVLEFYEMSVENELMKMKSLLTSAVQLCNSVDVSRHPLSFVLSIISALLELHAKNNHHSFTLSIFGMFSLLAPSTNTTQFYGWREHSFTLALQKREESLVQCSLIEQEDDDDDNDDGRRG